MIISPSGLHRQAQLDGLRTGDGRGRRGDTDITRELQRLELLLTMIAEIAAERNAVVNAGALCR
jgi:hypothetical protein